MKDERVRAAGVFAARRHGCGKEKAPALDRRHTARPLRLQDRQLRAGLPAHARGGADQGWALNYGGIALMWRGGCIIRSAFLGDIKRAFEREPALENLLLDPFFAQALARCTRSWRRVVAAAVSHGLPVPALASALAFFDGLRSARLPANLLQAQRDCFGAHAYERVDRPRGEFFHSSWGGTTGEPG
jgi:6-phosphogluconate dehydrogenase